MIKVMTPEFERALMLAWGHAAECDKELYWKVSARDDIVEALIVVGRKSEAIEILHQQLALLGPVPSPRYTAPLRKLASGFARAGDFDHALTVARGLSPLSEQVASLAKIASVMINNGFAAKGRDTFAIARNLVATGTDSWFGGQVDILLSDSLAERPQTIRYRQNHTLRDIAYYQTDCGLFPEAEETARLIENTHPFDYRSAILARVVLTEIRQILKDRGDVPPSRCQDLLTWAQSSNEWDLLAQAGATLARAGDTERARIAFQQATNRARETADEEAPEDEDEEGDEQSGVGEFVDHLIDIAKLQWRVGMFAEANATADLISEQDHFTESSAMVQALFHAIRGDMESALTVIRNLPDGAVESPAGEVALYLAESGHFPEARFLVDRLASPSWYQEPDAINWLKVHECEIPVQWIVARHMARSGQKDLLKDFCDTHWQRQKNIAKRSGLLSHACEVTEALCMAGLQQEARAIFAYMIEHLHQESSILLDSLTLTIAKAGCAFESDTSGSS